MTKHSFRCEIELLRACPETKIRFFGVSGHPLFYHLTTRNEGLASRRTLAMECRPQGAINRLKPVVKPILKWPTIPFPVSQVLCIIVTSRYHYGSITVIYRNATVMIPQWYPNV